MEWYYMQGGFQRGPTDIQGMTQFVKQGMLGPDDLVWNASMGQEWAPVSQVPELAAPPKSEPAADGGGGLRVQQREEVKPQLSPALEQHRPPAEKSFSPRKLWGYSCPDCGTRLHRNVSEGVGNWFGIAGMILAAAFGSMTCDKCGTVARREMSAWDNLRLLAGSLMLIAFGVALVIAAVMAMIWVQGME